jgi:hypothetical protein
MIGTYSMRLACARIALRSARLPLSPNAAGRAGAAARSDGEHGIEQDENGEIG